MSVSPTRVVHCDVVIVGAGPVGCTLALLCARHGLRVLVAERKGAPTPHPAAHVLNARSMEIWASIDPALAARILDAGAEFDAETLPQIAWRTSLAGPAIAAVDIFPDRAMLDRVVQQSAWRTTHLGQHRVEPILWDAVRRTRNIDFRTGWTATAVDLSASRASVRFETDAGAGSATARFVVSAEGAAARLRDSMGITLVGPTLAHNASVFFRAALPPELEREAPLLTWIYNPRFVGPLINHYDREWILMTPYLPGVEAPEDFTDAWWRDAIRTALGIDAPITVMSKGIWAMTARIADNYARGDFFVVGDAAHAFPPTGGYGLNTGVADAQNLAWKLAAVLRDQAGRPLLDSYAIERRPVAVANCNQSVANIRRMDMVSRHFGLRSEGLQRIGAIFARPPLRWLPRAFQRKVLARLRKLGLRRLAILTRPGPNHDAIVARLAPDIVAQRDHFGAFGLELGYVYREGAVLPEPGDPPRFGDGIAEYRPTTWPGARLPHVRVTVAGTPRDSHSLLATDALTLLVLAGHRHAWEKRLAEARSLLAYPVDLRPLDMPTEAWTESFEVPPSGAILVRPDGHVAWRSDGRDDSNTLDAALSRLSTLFGPPVDAEISNQAA